MITLQECQKKITEINERLKIEAEKIEAEYKALLEAEQDKINELNNNFYGPARRDVSIAMKQHDRAALVAAGNIEVKAMLDIELLRVAITKIELDLQQNLINLYNRANDEVARLWPGEREENGLVVQLGDARIKSCLKNAGEKLIQTRMFINSKKMLAESERERVQLNYDRLFEENMRNFYFTIVKH